jgi:hypothetical protein
MLAAFVALTALLVHKAHNDTSYKGGSDPSVSGAPRRRTMLAHTRS